MYDLSLDSAINKILDTKAKTVCVQLPDGLKPKAQQIKENIEAQTDAKILFWAGSCFGACDLPLHIERLGIDLLLQWGHSAWEY